MSSLSAPAADATKSLVQTRVPQAMRIYLKAYGKHHGLKMEGLLAEVLLHFMTLRPDTRGLAWRKPQSHRTDAGTVGGWAQINVLIPDDVAGKLAGLAMDLGISKAAISYTALYWFARYMRPPLNPALQPGQKSGSVLTNASGAAHG